MTATAPAGTPRTGGPVAPTEGDVVVVVRGGGAPSAATSRLAAAARTAAGPRLAPVVVDPDPAGAMSDLDVRRLVDHVHDRVADGPWRVPALLLVLDRAARAEAHGRSVAQRLAERVGADVIAPTTRVAPHPEGGLVALDGGRFVTVSPAGDLDPGPVAAAGLFPPPAWAAHVPAQAAFVGDTGLLDPVPAGIWLHTDPAARSSQQRMGRLAHAVPASPARPAVLLGTPGGRPLDLPAVAAALVARTALLDGAVIVPFGVPLAAVAELAQLLGRELVSSTAMIVTGEDGVPVIRTVGTDGHPGWVPFAPWVRVGPGLPAPAVTAASPVPDPGGTDVALQAVPAGLWLRESAAPLPAPADADVDPRLADVDVDGMRLFVGDPGVTASTRLMQAATSLLGRLDPAVRQGARIVLPGGAGAGDDVDRGSRASDATARVSTAAINSTATPAAARGVSEAAGPAAPTDAGHAATTLAHPVTPAPDVAATTTPQTTAPLAAAPDALAALSGRRPGTPDDTDIALVRSALGPVYGRLSGRASAVLAVEPGRAGGPHALAHLVALCAVTHPDSTDTGTELGTRVGAALAQDRTGPALVRAAAAGARALTTHRGVAFAVLDLDTLPEEGQVVSGPLFAQLRVARAPGDPSRVVLAVRTSSARRLGGLRSADGQPELLLAPGHRLRVLSVRPAQDAARLVLAVDAADERTDERWFDGRTDADPELHLDLPAWTQLGAHD